MYEELIKKLRYCGNAISCLHCPYWEGCGGSKEDLSQAADAIEELTDRNVGKWIPVTERLPDENGFYLVLYSHKYPGGIAMDEGLGIIQWYDARWKLNEIYAVTHWMPLPEPPKEET